MITVDEIRNQFPNPVTCYGDVWQYCVGGAFCTATDFWIKFPTLVVLKKHLQKVNPALDTIHAEYYARNIIDENDLGNFDNAWGFLDMALSFGQRGI